MGCFRYIIVSSLHKGDDNNNNNNVVVVVVVITTTKFKQLDHLYYWYLDKVLELLTRSKKNCKNWDKK